MADRGMSELSYIVTQDSKNRNKLEAIDQKIKDSLEQANQLKIDSKEKLIVDKIKTSYINYVQVVNKSLMQCKMVNLQTLRIFIITKK